MLSLRFLSSITAILLISQPMGEAQCPACQGGQMKLTITGLGTIREGATISFTFLPSGAKAAYGKTEPGRNNSPVKLLNSQPKNDDITSIPLALSQGEQVSITVTGASNAFNTNGLTDVSGFHFGLDFATCGGSMEVLQDGVWEPTPSISLSGSSETITIRAQLESSSQPDAGKGTIFDESPTSPGQVPAGSPSSPPSESSSVTMESLPVGLSVSLGHDTSGTPAGVLVWGSDLATAINTPLNAAHIRFYSQSTASKKFTIGNIIDAVEMGKNQLAVTSTSNSFSITYKTGITEGTSSKGTGGTVMRTYSVERTTGLTNLPSLFTAPGYGSRLVISDTLASSTAYYYIAVNTTSYWRIEKAYGTPDMLITEVEQVITGTQRQVTTKQKLPGSPVYTTRENYKLIGNQEFLVSSTIYANETATASEATAGHAAGDPLTTYYFYYETVGTPTNPQNYTTYRRIKCVIQADGNWTYYGYKHVPIDSNSTHRYYVVSEYRPYLDATMSISTPTLPTDNFRLTENYYTRSSDAGNRAHRERLEDVREFVKSNNTLTLVGKTFCREETSPTEAGPLNLPLRAETTYRFQDSSHCLMTRELYYKYDTSLPLWQRGKLYEVKGPLLGDLLTALPPTTGAISFGELPSTDGMATKTRYSYPEKTTTRRDEYPQLANQSLRHETVYDNRNRVIAQNTLVYNGSSYPEATNIIRGTTTEYERDDAGVETVTEKVGSVVTAITISNAAGTATTKKDKLNALYVSRNFGLNGRLSTEKIHGANAVNLSQTEFSPENLPELTTTHSYLSEAGWTKHKWEKGSSSLHFEGYETHDLAERLRAARDEATGVVTTYSYSDSGRTITTTIPIPNPTTTTPNAGSSTESRCIDGTPKSNSRSISATSALVTTWNYSILSNGFREVREKLGPGGTAQLTQKITIYDWLGNISEEKVSNDKQDADETGTTTTHSNGYVTTSYLYDTRGRLACAKKGNLAAHLIRYNDLDHETRSGYDIKNPIAMPVGNGLEAQNMANSLVPESTAADPDQIVDTKREYVSEGSGASTKWYLQITKNIPTTATGFVTKRVTKILQNTYTTSTDSGPVIGQTISQDGGNTRIQSRTTCALEYNGHPYLLHKNTTVSGRTFTVQESEGLTASYDERSMLVNYDALRRRIWVGQDEEWSHYLYEFTPTTVATSLPIQRWQYQYAFWMGEMVDYGYTAAGRISTITQGVFIRKIGYDAMGRVISEYGDTYPRKIEYDGYGRLKQIRTYKASLPGEFPAAFDDFTKGDVTAWSFHARSGLLKSKTLGYVAESTDPNAPENKTTSYTYQPNRLPLTRTDPRGAIATYAFTSGGQLSGVSYNQIAPTTGYSFVYDYQGRLKQVSVGGGTYCTQTYDDGYGRGELDTETWESVSPLAGCVLDRDYEVYAGRLEQVRVTNASGIVSRAAYQYGLREGRVHGSSLDDALDAIRGLDRGLTQTRKMSIQRHTGIGGGYWLRKGASYGDAAPVLMSSTTNMRGIFDGKRETTVHGVNLGRMFSQTVTMGSRSDQSIDTLWGIAKSEEYAEVNKYLHYNNYGELATVDVKAGSGLRIPGLQRSYDYDGIGNRKTSGQGGTGGAAVGASNLDLNNFTADRLNQYSLVNNPANVNLVGITAYSSDVVTVKIGLNGSDQVVGGSDRQGVFWRKQVIPPTGTSLPTYQPLVVKVNTTTQPIGDQAGVYFPQMSESLTYDNNGNLTADGRWEYRWDAENRLVSMWTSPLAQSGLSQQLRRKLDFTYDWQGRRIKKCVYNPTSNAVPATWSTTAAVTELYVYNGWKLAFRSHNEASNIWEQSFVWGPDQDAKESDTTSKVGGLQLMEMKKGGPNGASSSYFVFSDMSGNVALVAADSSPTPAARYAYGPFGEMERFTGELARDFPFRFSSEFTDQETGLVYYGHRYYNPRHGRWLSRDPIGEEGGLNLYGFVGNDPVNKWDYLGLFGTGMGIGMQSFISQGLHPWTGRPLHPPELEDGGMERGMERVLGNAFLRCYLIDLTDEDLSEINQAMIDEMNLVDTAYFQGMITNLPRSAGMKFLALNAAVRSLLSSIPQGSPGPLGISSQSVAAKYMNRHRILVSVRSKIRDKSIQWVGKGGVKIWGRIGSKILPFVGWFSAGYEAVKACNCYKVTGDGAFTNDEKIIGQ